MSVAYYDSLKMLKIDGGSMSEKCYFCKNNEAVDYKDAQLLKKFMTPSQKIIPRRITKLCAKHQRAVQRAIKRARVVALLPVTSE